MSDEIVLPDGEAFYLHPLASWRWPLPLNPLPLPPDLVGWLMVARWRVWGRWCM